MIVNEAIIAAFNIIQGVVRGKMKEAAMSIMGQGRSS